MHLKPTAGCQIVILIFEKKLWRGGVVSSNSVQGDVYLIQHYVIKFVSYLHQVSGFPRVLQFPPPVKLTAAI